MRFAALPYVYLLWCVPVLIGLYIYAFARKRQALGQFMALALAPRLLPEFSRLRQWSKASCLVAAVTFMVLGLMQPQWGKRWQKVPRRGRDLMILLDVSRSMLARDVIPNRLQRAKIDINDLVHVIQQEGGHRLGLVVFAGRASLQCPLTTDYAFFLQKLNEVGPLTVGQGGTLIGDAIRKALQGLGSLEHNFKDMILITDGEDHDSFPLEAAKAAAAQQVSIYVVGLGDPQVGARIPLGGDAGKGGFMRYQGQEVRSRMQEGLLLQIARLTGGAYVPAGTRSIELDRIYTDYVAPKARRAFDVASRERYIHRFQWFVLIALVLMAIEGVIPERRAAFASNMLPPRDASEKARQRLSTAMGIIAVLLLVWPTALRAASPYAAVRDGNALYQEGLYDKANDRYAAAATALPQTPEILFNRGNAFFKQHNYQEAFKHYSQALQGAGPALESRLKYNLGNVKYQEALQTLQAPQHAIPALREAMTYYRDSLDVDAQQHDARYNLELAHRLLKQLEQQQKNQQQQQSQQQQSQQQQSQQQQSQQQQSQQQQQQQSQQQQSQQQQSQQQQSQQQSEQDTASAAQDQQAGEKDNPPSAQRQVQMTPEEATRLLEAIRERGREMDAQRQQRRRARMRSKQVEKDW